METVWWVLKQLDNKGLFYRGHYVVAYSPKLGAVLSNFEANQNYKDVQDPAITVSFQLEGEDAEILAWTTTPWTLVSNLALCVGPNIDYCKVRRVNDGKCFILAEARREAVFGKEATEVLATFKGTSLKGKKYQPLFSYFKDHANAFQILVDDYVTTTDGTGIVHQAPAFGEDDYRICRAHNIEHVDPLNEEAVFTDKISDFKGQFIKDADKQIIRALKESGRLFKHDVLVHSYPHCERTEGPLIYRAIPAWYVRVEKMREKLVANNQKINWVPEHLRDGRMGKWLEQARDWAISRNRFWGTPIPVWICKNNEDHIHVVESVTELETKTGRKINDIHKHFIDDLTFKCTKCEGTMHRVPEVFDCWFESGSMPYAQHHYPFENKERMEKNFPADFIAEGLDQTRGWFYTLSILSEALFGKPAFKNVVVNGLVLAKDGKKMSKRLGNYTPPGALLDQLGSDSVRLYMLNSPILKAEPLRFADEGVRDTTRAVMLPYWNAFSFLSTYAAAEGWTPSQELQNGKLPSGLTKFDRWIVSRLQSLVAGVQTQMESYRLYAVVPEVLQFIDELTNCYIRLNRRRFWGMSGDQKNDTICAFSTLYYVLLQFTKVFAPFAPFVTERVFAGLTEGTNHAKNDSVHLQDMPTPDKTKIDLKLEKDMDLLLKVISLGRSIRAKEQIKTRQVLKSLTVVTTDPSDQEVVKTYSQIMRDELNVKEVEFSTDESTVVTLDIKPNLKILGKKLGKDLPKFRASLDAISKDATKSFALARELNEKGRTSVDGLELLAEEFLIERKPLAGTASASFGSITVQYDINLTDALIREGLAREIVNRVQNLRKDSGLNVSDRIRLTLTGSDLVRASAKEFGSYISSETLASSYSVVDSSISGATNFDLEGETLDLSLSKDG